MDKFNKLRILHEMSFDVNIYSMSLGKKIEQVVHAFVTID